MQLPIRGQWHTLNSPAHRIPSHGTHFLAQTYAYDFTAVDDEMQTSSNRKRRHQLSLRRPAEFYAFDQPILAPLPGTVIAVSDRSRDHR
jgi:hypothetical protein